MYYKAEFRYIHGICLNSSTFYSKLEGNSKSTYFIDATEPALYKHLHRFIKTQPLIDTFEYSEI